MTGIKVAIRWLPSLIRAAISALAGLGAACIANHFSHQPNTALVVGAILTGLTVTVLNATANNSRMGSPPESTPHSVIKPGAPPLDSGHTRVEVERSEAHAESTFDESPFAKSLFEEEPSFQNEENGVSSPRRRAPTEKRT